MKKTPLPSKSNRLNGLDLARYVAFVGMVIVNFNVVMGAEDDMGLTGCFTKLLSGRAAATFVVLAGIGLGLASLREQDQLITLTFKRAAFLFIVGLLNMVIFVGDILHYYAIYFLIGIFSLSLSSRKLFCLIISLNITFTIMILTLNYDAGWNWNNETYSGFWTLTGFVRNLFFNGWHPTIPWVGFFLFGIILSRISLGKKATQIKLIVGGTAAYVTAEGLSVLFIAQIAPIDPEFAQLMTTTPLPPMPLYTLAGSGAACIVIGVCLLISKKLEAVGILHVLVPAGRQTLTLYIAHILIGMGTLKALNMLGGQSATLALGSAILFSLVAGIYAFIWAKWFNRGPIETLMRKIAG